MRNTLFGSAWYLSTAYLTMLAMALLSEPPSRFSVARDDTSQHPPSLGDSGYTTTNFFWSASPLYGLPL